MSQADDTLSHLIEGFRTTALISTAVRMGIVDALTIEPSISHELAETLKLNKLALRRFLRGLAAIGIVEEHLDITETETQFSLTEAGLLLRSDAKSHFPSYALLCETQYLPAFFNMEPMLREGINPFESTFGKPVWKHREDNPEAGALFNQWLHGQSSTLVDDLVAALDLSAFNTIADVGGGKGILLSRILQQYSDCRGILADQPSVVKEAEALFQKTELTHSCDFVPTDFFVSVPKSCDAYLLKSILHDWDDDDSRRVLASIHEAMAPGSRLFVIERIMPKFAHEDEETIWIDMMMMNMTGGRERTLKEYEVLLEEANLPMTRSIPTGSSFQIMEAIKK